MRVGRVSATATCRASFGLLICLFVLHGSASLAAGPADADASRTPAPTDALRHMVLSGRVTSMGVSQLEPGATPQASFYLDTDAAAAGSQRVLVVIPWPRFPCMDGMRATLEGDFSPADRSFPPMLLSPKILSCDGVTAPRGE